MVLSLSILVVAALTALAGTAICKTIDQRIYRNRQHAYFTGPLRAHSMMALATPAALPDNEANVAKSPSTQPAALIEDHCDNSRHDQLVIA